MPCASRTCEAPQPQGFAHAGADRRLSRWLVSVGSGEHRHFQSRASDGSFKLFVPVRPHAAHPSRPLVGSQQCVVECVCVGCSSSKWAGASCVYISTICRSRIADCSQSSHRGGDAPRGQDTKIRRYKDTKIQKEGRRRPLTNATTNPIMKRIARGKKALAHPSPLPLSNTSSHRS